MYFPLYVSMAPSKADDSSKHYTCSTNSAKNRQQHSRNSSKTVSARGPRAPTAAPQPAAPARNASQQVFLPISCYLVKPSVPAYYPPTTTTNLQTAISTALQCLLLYICLFFYITRIKLFLSIVYLSIILAFSIFLPREASAVFPRAYTSHTPAPTTAPATTAPTISSATTAAPRQSALRPQRQRPKTPAPMRHTVTCSYCDQLLFYHDYFTPIQTDNCIDTQLDMS